MGRTKRGLIICFLADFQRACTYALVWVWEVLRGAVEGFKVKGFLFVKGDHFGKWSSMILTEHLALSVTEIQKEKAMSGCGKVNTVSTYCIFELADQALCTIYWNDYTEV